MHGIKAAGIILAGGSSRRFGRPKQLLKLKGKYLLEHLLNAALGSRLDEVVLVLGHAHQNILQKLEAYAGQTRLQVVINHRYNEGQSRSLQAGLLRWRRRREFVALCFLLPVVVTEPRETTC